MSTQADAKTFFSSPYYAVVGASANPAKYGYKVFAWYIDRSLPVTPINPSTPAIPVSGTEYKTVRSLSAVPNPTQTSVSIITPPKVTLSTLKEAKELGIPAVWMQPGSFDDEVLRFAREEAGFKAVVAGDGGRGSEGWCVLVDGDRGLKAAGKL